jgi:hypothetical protein
MINVIARVVAREHWEIIADNLKKPVGVGAASQRLDSNGQTIFVADAHRDNGKRFIVTADEKLTAFLELQRVTRESLRS